MNIEGSVHRITDLAGFIQARLAGKEDPKTFTAMGGLRVEAHVLAKDFLGGSLPFPMPDIVFSGKTNGKGAFSIKAPDGKAGADTRLLVQQKLSVVTPFNVSIYAPVYRSTKFDLGQANGKKVKIFVHFMTGSPEDGVSQADLNKIMAEAKKDNKLDKLRGTIVSGKIKVHGEKSGADVDFEIILRPSTSGDLDQLVGHKISNFDIDLPGPDFIVGLCVDEDEIEGKIRKGIGKALKEANKDAKKSMVDAAAAQLGVPASVVQTLVDTEVSVTVNDIDYPVTQTIDLPIGKAHIRAVSFDPVIGFPRKPY